jgi:hypothetical protein
MGRPDPVKTYLMEGGAECDELKIIHSNKLQEVKYYTYPKQRPEDGNPIKFYLLNYGNSVQPGDPVLLKCTITGESHVDLYEDNYDVNISGNPGYARLVVDPPRITDGIELTWPVEFQVVDNSSINYNFPGSTLKYRSQWYWYKPGLSDSEIESDPLFVSRYRGWLQKRDSDYYHWNDVYPEPPEEYEITNAKRLILEDLRILFERRWSDWEYGLTVVNGGEDGYYWTGKRSGPKDGGPPIFEAYSYTWTPTIEPKLYRTDGSVVDGEGVDPVTLLGYEFLDDGRSDINNIDDWLNVLNVGFSGTPAPLTIECAEPCEEGCLPLYDNVLHKVCICKGKVVNETDAYTYQPYEHNQSKPRLNDFNP